MPGAIAIVVVLVVVIPVAVVMSGAVGAGLLGWLVKSDVDERFEGTEELEIS